MYHPEINCHGWTDLFAFQHRGLYHDDEEDDVKGWF